MNSMKTQVIHINSVQEMNKTKESSRPAGLLHNVSRHGNNVSGCVTSWPLVNSPNSLFSGTVPRNWKAPK